MTYKIEKGIERPERNGPHGKRGRVWKFKSRFPLDEMEVDDSIYLENEDERNSASSAAYGFRRHKPLHVFETQRWGDGFRIWRVK